MATKQKTNGKSNNGNDKGHSKPALTSAEQDAIRRAQKRKSRANAPVGLSAVNADKNVGSFQRVLQEEYRERETRMELAALAAQHPAVQEIRTNIQEMKELRSKATGRRKAEIGQKIALVTRQVTEIDSALLAFGQKSKVTKGVLRKDAILDIRMSNGYLRRIVRDALFGALREYHAANAPLTDAMAS